MKNWLIVVLFSTGILIGLGYGSTKAADVEVILGTSSGFKIVRGTSVSAGTSTFFVGSSTVSIGTTTQSSMLTIVGSSTSSSDAALKVGTATLWVGNDGKVGIGTTTPQFALVVGSGNGPSTTVVTDLVVSGEVNTGTITSINGSSGTVTVQRHLQVNGTLTASSVTAARNLLTAGTVTIGSVPMSESPAGTITLTGNLRVTGAFTAATKSFLIPHTDPEKRGWLLRHSTVEAPTRGDNLYRYQIVIKSDGGDATIPLSSYWKYLNENPQVWVTAIGQFANGYGYVDETSNKLIIKGEKKGGYNVLLVGTRKDKLAKDFFDAQGVEFEDKEMCELFTRGEKQEEKYLIQLMNANNAVNSKFVDPIGDELGLALCQ